MACRQCAYESPENLSSEIAVHLPGLNTPHVLLYSALLVCLNCGFTEFSVAETDLQLITARLAPAKSGSAVAA